ncbi:hypothetical protein CBR70_06745 [Bordetella hinzii]|nr:hypothetical protein CBR70_06745 [Bordetella hinzii]QDJ54490.1 hypothetical protein CBR72_06465 [Bordetella hinzii]
MSVEAFRPHKLLGIHIMSNNEKSSKALASLAGKVLQQKSSTQAAKRLAGSVLTQAPDRKPSGGKKSGK